MKTWLEINSRVLLGNLYHFKNVVGPNVNVVAVIKSNAYGHGLIGVASVLKKDKSLFFGVDSLDEALSLKNTGVKNPILILGYIPETMFAEAVKNNFHISVYNTKTLASAIKFPKGLYHLKAETGTNRLGVSIADLKKFSILPKFVGVYTHFADIENKNSNFYKKQLIIFAKTQNVLKSRDVVPKFIHTASTAGILRGAETHFNMVRLGIGLYKNVLTWKTRVAQVKSVKIGQTIGYDRTFKARKNMKIAILPVGYYDGYDRKLSNTGEVLISGKKAKVVGRVCMNMFMADVTKIKNVKVGDEVVLLGGPIKTEDVAKKIGTIDYEVLSRLNPNLPRVVI